MPLFPLNSQRLDHAGIICLLHRVGLTCLLLVLAAGCSISKPYPANQPITAASPSSSPIPTQITATQSPQVPIPTENESTAPTVTQPALSQVCSPLYGFQLVQLGEIISTPFDPPAPGQDSGHHGVDFGFYSYGAFTKMEGLPVQSILSGRVSAVIDDRPPYGNMAIIETPLSSLPESWQKYIAALPAQADYKLDGRLVCPTPEETTPPQTEKSLYILYAHLADPPSFSIGDPVGCGQQFGFVGNTGFSGNAHLHLEMRLGPSEAQFLHLAHYVNNATSEEMAGYCYWRISPDFRLLDPLDLLQKNP